MDRKTALKMDLTVYRGQEEFLKLYDFARQQFINLNPDFTYTRRDNIRMDMAALVRQAEFAYSRRAIGECAANLEFTLAYITSGFIPYEVFDSAAINLAKKYRAATGDSASEETAMAVVLQATIGGEQRKIQIIRDACAMQTQKMREAGGRYAPVWGMAQALTRAKYRIDFIAYIQGKVATGYQLEWKEQYFDYLEYRKVADALSDARRKEINLNRIQSNAFLDKYPNGKIVLLSCKANNAGQTRLMPYGEYQRVEPLRAGA